MTTNETAVMLGDFLFSRSFLLCSGIDSQRANQLIGQAAATVCEGELLQLSHRGKVRLTEDLYFTIIDRKTAALTAVACEVGALFADAPPRVVHGLREFGRSVGIAFQIVDDILDCTGDTIETGKVPGTDLRDGTPTLPLLLAAEQDEVVRAAIAGGPLEGVLVRVAASGALERSREVALDYARRARESLAGETRRTELVALADAVVERDR